VEQECAELVRKSAAWRERSFEAAMISLGLLGGLGLNEWRANVERRTASRLSTAVRRELVSNLDLLKEAQTRALRLELPPTLRTHRRGYPVKG
jgi:hypothetical protein